MTVRFELTLLHCIFKGVHNNNIALSGDSLVVRRACLRTIKTTRADNHLPLTNPRKANYILAVYTALHEWAWQTYMRFYSLAENLHQYSQVILHDLHVVLNIILQDWYICTD